MTHVIAHHPLTAEAWDPRLVHMVLAVDKVALGQIFFQVLWFSTVRIIPIVPSTYSLTYHTDVI
jgi:hypothetical protein